ncbi:TolC family protein [Parasediminibacterium paludis]|uniref:TolC family protein n=1 Tax=Parasediminibacterium paludis TaxID=908966 RepID=A0ABV8Q1U5_9BACT
MKIKSIIGFLILLTSSIVQAQKTIGLNDILQTIDTANPTAKMYAAQIRSLDEAAKGARSWMPTDFGSGLWMTPYNPKLLQKGDNGATGMGQYMLSVQQMFPNKKKQDAEAAYMQGMSAPEKERQKFELNQLYAEAKKNYYQWAILKKKMNVLNENEKLLNFMIKDAEIRYKNGIDKLGAYYKAKAELGRILNTKVELENEMAQNRIRLNTLMNRNKFEPFDIDTTYTIRNFTTTTFDTTSLSNRSDIRAIDKDIQLTYLQQNVERTKVKPEFGIRYDHMFGFGGFPMQYTLMGMAKISLGKANRASKANVESLRWKSEALFQQKQILLNEATGMATSMIADIETKKKQVKLFEENILPALRKNYQVMQLAYQQNTEQLFTLFDAWDALNKTQIEYLNQLQQLLTMHVELERIMEVK